VPCRARSDVKKQLYFQLVVDGRKSNWPVKNLQLTNVYPRVILEQGKEEKQSGAAAAGGQLGVLVDNGHQNVV